MTQYVARKEMTVNTPNGVVEYKPGDLIPDFEQWDIHARRANLNLEWVERVDEKSAAPVKKTEQVKQEAETEAASELSCPKCDRGSFKSERALKTHIGIAHKS